VHVPAGVRQVDGLEISLSTGEQYGFSHRDAEVGESTIPSGRMTLGPLRGDGRVLTDWTEWAAKGGATLSAAGGRHELRYAFDTGQTIFVRRPQATDRWPLPVVVSTDLGRSLRPGTRFPLDFGDVQLQAEVVGVASRFPDAEQFGEGFVIADESALSTALDARLAGRGDPLEVWISAPSSAQRRVAAALGRPPFGALDVASRRAIAARLAGDPLARAIEIALIASALAALALAALGFLVALVSDLRDERGDLFDLEAQGVTPVVLRRQFQIRSLVLVVFGVGGGVILGLVLSRLVVALVQVSAADTVPDPPLRLVPAWNIGLTAAAVLIAVLVCLVELVTRRAFAQDLPPRANWSLE
jgi:FtsX-like permease family protein